MTAKSVDEAAATVVQSLLRQEVELIKSIANNLSMQNCIGVDYNKFNKILNHIASKFNVNVKDLEKRIRPFIIEVCDNKILTIYGALLLHYQDLRKYPDTSRMRTLGYTIELCEMVLPDFKAVKADDVASNLAGLARAAAKIWHPTYSKEQYEAISQIVRAVDSNKPGVIILALPTGFGKTEAFLLPALYTAEKGGLSIIVYPRIALASDQARRIAELWLLLKKREKVKSLPQVVIYDGKSCSLSRHSKCEGKFKRVSKLTIQENSKIIEYELLNSNRPWTIWAKSDNERIELEVSDIRLEDAYSIGRIKPNILLTNYDMLNQLLTGLKRLRESNIYRSFSLSELLPCSKDKRTPLLLVFDEAHEYRDADILNLLALTIRLVIEANEKGCNVIIVFSSATLPQNFDTVVVKAIETALNSKVDYAKIVPISGRHRLIAISLLLPDPETSGQWLLQLASLLTSLAGRAFMLRSSNLPLKSIVFVDSLRYQTDIVQGIKATLYNDLKQIIVRHIDQHIVANDIVQNWHPLLSGTYHTTVDISEFINMKFEDYFKIHRAGMSERQRSEIEMQFKNSANPLTLIATSTLEMGVDFPYLAAVLQFRRPRSPESAMQRIGRAARSSKTLWTGIALIALTNTPRDALLLLDADERRRLLYHCFKSSIQQYIPKLKIPFNRAAILQHLFYTLLQFAPKTSDVNLIDLQTKVIEKVENINNAKKYLNDLLRLVDEAQSTLKRYVNAYYEAIKSVLSHSEAGNLRMPSLNELLDELRKSINLALEKINKASLDVNIIKATIDTYKNKIRELIGKHKIIWNCIEAITQLSKASNCLRADAISEVEQRHELLRTLNDSISIVANVKRELEALLTTIEESSIKLSLGLSEDKENILNVIDGLLSSVEMLRLYVEDEIKVVNELSPLMIDAFAETARKVVQDIHDVLEDFNRDLRQILEERMNLNELLQLRLIEFLAHLTSKPYFTILMKTPGQRVSISYYAFVGQQKPLEKRDDTPLDALYRVVPLSKHFVTAYVEEEGESLEQQ